MRLLSFLRNQDGAAAVLTALSAVALVGFTGLATDVGSVYLESRRLQGAADLAALAAMQNPAQAEALAAATVSANRWPDVDIDIVRGTYAPDRSVRPAERFRPNAPSANALRVELTSDAPLYFARLFVPSGQMTIRRRATAAQTRFASFQIGSRLLALQGGVANQVLTSLTGSSVSLSVMDYNALISADVDLLSYVEALRTRLDMQAATFDETLAHDTEVGTALNALGDVLAQSDRRAEGAMRQLAASGSAGRRSARLDSLLDLGPYGAQDHATHSGSTRIDVSAMDLASAILQIANGDRQVRLNLGAGVPGLASTDVWLAIGERPNNSPWIAVTDDEQVIIRTAQARLFADTRVGAPGLSALAQVRVPVLIELASAQARLNDITCSLDARRNEVTLDVAPSIGGLRLGDIDTRQLGNFKRDLTVSRTDLFRTALIRVEGLGRVDLGGYAWQRVRFSGADIERGTVKSASTRDVARATVASLVGNTDLTVRVAGLGLSTSTVTNATRGALTQAAAPLDGLVNGLSDFLGLRLGEADVRVNGVRCGGAALVA